MIQTVFIDIDDTLLSFEGYVKESMKSGFEKFGLPAYKEYMFSVFTQENNKLWQALERGELTFSELRKVRWNIIFKALDIEADGEAFEAFFRDNLYNSAVPVEGAYEMLEYLSGKYTLCAASNGPYEQQVHRMEISGMKKYFDYLFISEEIGFSKPSEDYFSVCFERLKEEGKLPENRCEMLMLGDSLTSDMAGGRAAGMKTCLFNPKQKAVPEDRQPDYVIKSLSEIKEIL